MYSFKNTLFSKEIWMREALKIKLVIYLKKKTKMIKRFVSSNFLMPQLQQLSLSLSLFFFRDQLCFHFIFLPCDSRTAFNKSNTNCWAIYIRRNKWLKLMIKILMLPSSLFLHDIIKAGFQVSVIIAMSNITISTDIKTIQNS